MSSKAQNVAIAVDLSQTDEKLLKYAQFLVDKLNIEKLSLIHVIPSFFSSADSISKKQEFFGFECSLKDRIKERILKNIRSILSKELKTEIKILEGIPYKELVNYLGDKHADMVIVGRKKRVEGSGVIAQKIARNYTENILFVPEQTIKEIKQIVVPVDFSVHSARALSMALELTKKIKGSSLLAVHVVKKVSISYPIGLEERNALDAQIYLNTINAWQRFLAEHNLEKEEIIIEYIQNVASSTSILLHEFFESQETDLIVMGAKGHSAFERFTFGSVTEALINQCDNFPLLIIR